MTKQINIQDLLPFLRKGWVAMDKNEKWCWFKCKPITHFGYINKWLRIDVNHEWHYLSCFNISPVEDWTKSLICIKDDDEYNDIPF